MFKVADLVSLRFDFFLNFEVLPIFIPQPYYLQTSLEPQVHQLVKGQQRTVLVSAGTLPRKMVVAPSVDTNWRREKREIGNGISKSLVLEHEIFVLIQVTVHMFRYTKFLSVKL